MNRVETVGLFTVPSTYVTAFTKPIDAPYKRVVGFCMGDGSDIKWARTNDRRPEADYSPSDAAVETIPMPTRLADRLGSFFTRFCVNDPRTEQYGPLGDMHVEAINCHRFAYWMVGDAVAQEMELPPEPNHVIVDGNQSDMPLTLGTHGVIGTDSNSKSKWNPAAHHSVIGLGENREDCLNVLGYGGFLGLVNYRAIYDYYNSFITPDLQLYTER